ncbi:hypothetical protein RB195_013166 [Necator americanus]|uniref:Uncharacterized protein n=1 Tax=Necator americanus TaxID=51031 RepID=A0ABR1DUA5_NECAM
MPAFAGLTRCEMSRERIRDAHHAFFLLAKCPGFRSKGQNSKYSGVEEIQLKTDASICFVEFGQHSFRLADAKCYQNDVISKAQMNGEIPGREVAVQLSKYLYVLSRDALVVQGF